MHPSDYTRLPGLECLYTGLLSQLPQRQQMELGEAESVVGGVPGPGPWRGQEPCAAGPALAVRIFEKFEI